MREAAGAEVGDTVALEISPEEKAPEPKVPADLRKALAANPAAKATWTDITPVARRDWIAWIISGKKAETRVKRIDPACDQLASGMRRACCFHRSGLYSRGHMGAPAPPQSVGPLRPPARPDSDAAFAPPPANPPRVCGG